LREHIQWNVDILGEDDIAADAEVLAVALDGLRLLGLTADDIVARYNDRRLLEALLVGLGVPADRLPATYAVVDKLTREPPTGSGPGSPTRSDSDAGKADAVLELFDDGSLERLRSEFGADANVAAELDRMTQYEQRLSELDFTDFVVFDPAIVRGLAYYTGTVFEIFDRKGELRAVCGGGRYDRLLASVGGPDLPAWASAWATWCSPNSCANAACCRTRSRPWTCHRSSGRGTAAAAAPVRARAARGRALGHLRAARGRRRPATEGGGRARRAVRHYPGPGRSRARLGHRTANVDR
jgi:hypothetical protein